MPSHSSPASPDPGPGLRHLLTHLHHDHDPTLISEVSPPSPKSQHDYSSPVKLPPNYPASTHDPFPLHWLRPGTRPNAQVLSIRTTDISHGSGVLSAGIRVASSRSGLAFGTGDPFDLPPAFTAIDMSCSPLQLCARGSDAVILPRTIPLTPNHSLLRPLQNCFFLLCVIYGIYYLS
ncbi:hypothetical protein EDB89DRAFT_1219085 [Lactarius sanguifluus]|nr:hypothetical protein EDB89DRAFT_1219085 [Lactarius sanguifluus]